MRDARHARRAAAGRRFALGRLAKDVVVFSVLVVFGALVLFVILSGRELPGLSYGLTVGIVGSAAASAYLTGLSHIFGWPTSRSGHLKGLRRIAEKNALERADWFSLLTEAKREFYVAGHSMGLWCSPSNREEFVEELRRIVRGGGTVTLVMLGPKSEPRTVWSAQRESTTTLGSQKA